MVGKIFLVFLADLIWIDVWFLYFRKWSMVVQSTTGSVLTFQGMFRTVLPVVFAMNLPKCAIYLAWYKMFPLLNLIFVYSLLDCLIFNSLACNQAFNPEPVVPPVSARPDQVEKVLKTRYHDAKRKLPGKELDLLIVILPDNNGSLYGK